MQKVPIFLMFVTCAVLALRVSGNTDSVAKNDVSIQLEVDEVGSIADSPLHSTECVQAWSFETVIQWARASFSKNNNFIAAVTKLEINGKVLTLLDDSDFKDDLGITSSVLRKKILSEVQDLASACDDDYTQYKKERQETEKERLAKEKVMEQVNKCTCSNKTFIDGTFVESRVGGYHPDTFTKAIFQKFGNPWVLIYSPHLFVYFFYAIFAIPIQMVECFVQVPYFSCLMADGLVTTVVLGTIYLAVFLGCSVISCSFFSFILYYVLSSMLSGKRLYIIIIMAQISIISILSMSAITASYSTMQLPLVATLTLNWFAVGIAYFFEKAPKMKAAKEKWERERPAREKAAREKAAKEMKIATKLGVAVDKVVFVYPGTDLVQKGYDEVIKKGLKYLYLMKGTHIMTKELSIEHPINIIGAGRDQTFVEGYGGFKIKGKKEEGKNVVLKDMTISESGSGVSGSGGLSWLCDSLTITQCGRSGVYAYNTKGRLINCVITQCGSSGIYCSSNALIELEGDQTKVGGNVTSGWGDYGLDTSNTSSTIHLLFPLTQESVSTNNGGGGNCGGDGTIKTVKSF